MYSLHLYLLFLYFYSHYFVRLQKLNKEQEDAVKLKDEQILVLESELKLKEETINQQKQEITKLKELLNRHLIDQTRPDVKHRMGECN